LHSTVIFHLIVIDQIFLAGRASLEMCDDQALVGPWQLCDGPLRIFYHQIFDLIQSGAIRILTSVVQIRFYLEPDFHEIVTKQPLGHRTWGYF
jgi:hypothetical protein